MENDMLMCINNTIYGGEPQMVIFAIQYERAHAIFPFIYRKKHLENKQNYEQFVAFAH